MADPFDWSPRNLGPSREERAAAAAGRALPRRGYTYAASDGLTDRQRRRALAVQRSEQRRQKRERHRQTMAEARAEDRARRRARRDAGDVPYDGPPMPPWSIMSRDELNGFEVFALAIAGGLLLLGGVKFPGK